MTNKLLSEFSVGERGSVKAVSGEGKMRRRLFDMGVTPGRRSSCARRRRSETLEVTIRGYELTLRKTEAACVEMEVAK